MPYTLNCSYSLSRNWIQNYHLIFPNNQPEGSLVACLSMTNIIERHFGNDRVAEMIERTIKVCFNVPRKIYKLGNVGSFN